MTKLILRRGRRYQLRNNLITGPLRRNPDSDRNMYYWAGDIETRMGDVLTAVWNCDGRRLFAGLDSEFDIVRQLPWLGSAWGAVWKGERNE